jgi:hypothetical protein
LAAGGAFCWRVCRGAGAKHFFIIFFCFLQNFFPPSHNFFPFSHFFFAASCWVFQDTPQPRGRGCGGLMFGVPTVPGFNGAGRRSPRFPFAAVSRGKIKAEKKCSGIRCEDTGPQMKKVWGVRGLCDEIELDKAEKSC